MALPFIYLYLEMLRLLATLQGTPVVDGVSLNLFLRGRKCRRLEARVPFRWLCLLESQGGQRKESAIGFLLRRDKQEEPNAFKR